MRIRFVAALAVMTVLIAAPLHAGDVAYRWVDADGIVHYAEFPPATGPYERIRKATGARAAAPPASDTKAFLERVDAANKAEAEAVSKQEEAAGESAQKCAQARERLSFLDERTARRLAVQNEDGSVARMDDEEFERRRAAAQQDIEGNCG